MKENTKTRINFNSKKRGKSTKSRISPHPSLPKGKHVRNPIFGIKY
jgi:hypothetical protein